MKDFFNFFIENSKLSFTITFALLFIGTMRFYNLRRESRPAVDFAQAVITTIVPGSSPQEVEDLVTFKIEEQIQIVDGIKSSRSISAQGLAYTHLRIDIDNVDSQYVVDELIRSLNRVQDLPDNILEDPLLVHIKASEIPLLEVILTGDNTNRKRDELAFQLKTLIEREPGAALVQLKGYNKREFRVLLNSEKMIQNHVGIEEVIRSVRNHTQDFSPGVIRSTQHIQQVRLLGKVQQASELESTVVRSNFSGQKILLKDIAQVFDSQEEPTDLLRFNGEPATQLIVLKKEKADSIQLSNRIHKVVNNWNKPEGYSAFIYDDEAQTTRERLSIVINNAWFGFTLVLIVLLILLPGQMGLLSALSLPISILGTVALCSSFGITFNAMTMMAVIISIGMLVDNSVVISENYARLRGDGISTHDASLRSVLRLYKPITATVLTTVFAFLPMLVTKGIMGQFIMWIPIVVSVALLSSLFDALFLLPARLKIALRKSQIQTSRIQSEFLKLTNKFENFVSYCIQRRYKTFSALTALIVVSLSVNFWGNEFILFPSNDVRYYTVMFEAEEGSSIQHTDILSHHVIPQIIETVGEEHIEGLVSKSGQQTGFGRRASIGGEYSGEMILFLKKESSLRYKADSVLRELRKIDKGELKTLLFTALAPGPPVGDPIHLVFTSGDRKILDKVSTEFKNQLSKISGVIEIKDDQNPTGDEFQIFPNDERLAELNITSQTIGVALQTALRGFIVGESVEKGESFYTRVYYDDDSSSDIENLKKIKLLTPRGSLIPLEEMIHIKHIEEGSPIYKRYDFLPSLEVTAQIDTQLIMKDKIDSTYEKIKWLPFSKTFENSLKKLIDVFLPSGRFFINQAINSSLDEIIENFPGVSYLHSGERENVEESLSSLKQATILATFAIFSILLVLFRHFLVSLLALSSIALGLVGVSWAFALHQKPLSFLALIGIIGLAGVTINASIILISFIEDTKKNHPELDLYKILARATKYRFRPILITTCTTVLGLLPAAYGLGGEDRLIIPMTLAFTWGLLTGSFLTLIWIPCGYGIIDDISRKYFKKDPL